MNEETGKEQLNTIGKIEEQLNTLNFVSGYKRRAGNTIKETIEEIKGYYKNDTIVEQTKQEPFHEEMANLIWSTNEISNPAANINVRGIDDTLKSNEVRYYGFGETATEQYPIIPEQAYKKKEPLIAQKLKTGARLSYDQVKANLYPKSSKISSSKIEIKEEIPIVKEIINETINDSEEIYINYNELSDELAINELKLIHGNYDEVSMLEEYTNLVEKYKKIILKNGKNSNK